MLPKSWPWTSTSGSLSQSLSTFLCLTLALSTLAQSATILPSEASDTFPACGLTCATLNSAAQSCLAAPNGDQSIYVSCFCQSALLTNFQTSASGTCDDTCTTDSDRQLLQTWYLDYCQNGGNVDSTDSTDSTDSSSDSSDTSDTTTSDPNTSNTSDTSNTSSNTTSSDSESSTATRVASPGSQTWWDTHYKWVIMIIVLAVGFTAIAFLGIWLKRRHDAKYPNLYHGAGGANDSRLFNRNNDTSPVPGPGQPLMASRRHDSANTMSIASSSRTDVIVPPKTRSAAGSSRLQKSTTVAEDDIEIREVPR